MKRKTGVVLAASLAVILAAAGLQTSRRHPMAGSLFSWNKTAVSEEGIEAVLTIDEQLPLTQLFQEFPLDMLEEKSEIRNPSVYQSAAQPGNRLLCADGQFRLGA